MHQHYTMKLQELSDLKSDISQKEQDIIDAQKQSDDIKNHIDNLQRQVFVANQSLMNIRGG